MSILLWILITAVGLVAVGIVLKWQSRDAAVRSGTEPRHPSAHRQKRRGGGGCH